MIEPTDRDCRICTWQDLQGLWQRQKRRLGQWVLFCMVGSFLFWGTQPVLYKAEGRFKEGADKPSVEGGLKDVLGVFGGASKETQAKVCMQSSQVLRPVVERMGLQISYQEKGSRFFRLLRRLGRSLWAEWGGALRDLDVFAFQNVVYEEEAPLSFCLSFSDATHFTAWTQKNPRERVQGVVGKECVLGSLRWVVSHVPSSLSLKKVYAFQAQRWQEIVHDLKRRLMITSTKGSPFLYELSWKDPDRYRASDLVNLVMQEYRQYLKTEHDQLMDKQLSYLEKKQGKVFEGIEQNLQEYMDYLRGNLASKGFLGTQRESYRLLEPYEKIASQVLAIDIELDQIAQIEQGQRDLFCISDGMLAERLRATAGEMETLYQQRDLLEIAVRKHREGPEQMQEFRRAISKVREKRKATQALLEGVISGQLDLKEGILENPLVAWAQELQDHHLSQDREDLQKHLSKTVHLLSVQEQMFQERFSCDPADISELEGIDLETARKLLMECNAKLDQVRVTLRYYAQLQEEIRDSGLELSTLGSVLNDPLAQRLIEEARSLTLRLQDAKYHSDREELRWKQELQSHRQLLLEHIGQLHKMEQVNVGFQEEKLKELQRVCLDCVHQQISVLGQQAHLALSQRKEALFQEKRVLQEKMKDLREWAAEFPEKWQREKWLEIQTRIGEQMITALSQIVESKTIHHHLYHIESKALDQAAVPIAPLSPRLGFLSILSGLGGGFLLFVGLFFHSLLEGFPVTEEKLRLLRWPFLGRMSSLASIGELDLLSQHDRDAFRKMHAFLQSFHPTKKVALILGKGADYCRAFARYLQQVEKRVVIVRCDFLSGSDSSTGIAQYCRGEVQKVPVYEKQGLFWVDAGEKTSFGLELLRTKQGRKLLEELERQFDYLLFTFPTRADSEEALEALSFCEGGIVSLLDERPELLTPLVDWQQNGLKERLGFLMTSQAKKTFSKKSHEPSHA